MKRRAIVGLACLCLLSMGCTTVGPDYRRPEIAVPDRFRGSPQPAADPGTAAADPAGWWTAFGDPLLDSLVRRALAGNLDVQSAASRIREARAREIVAGARGRPELQAAASATHRRISENAVSPADLGGGEGGGRSGDPAIALPGAEFENFRVGFDASWELDLFGGTRRAVEAARARTGAAVWSRRDLEISIAAEVANAYFALRTIQQRIAIAEADLERQNRFERIVRARTEGGLVSGLGLRQQQTDRARTAAEIPLLRAQERGRIHALGVLTGDAPDALFAILAAPAAVPPVPPGVPVGLPSDLLRRRPDIRAAERELAAATADIGVAVAEHYPRITLTASPALVSQALTSLLEWGSRTYALGAGLSWPLFQSGRVRGNIEVADARQEQALLGYRQAVLTGLSDVEDALSQYEGNRQRLTMLERALGTAEDAEALARTRYRGGLVALSEVLAAQGRRLDAEDQLIQTRGALARDAVALYKALGGGWHEGAGPAPIPSEPHDAGARR